MTQTSKELLKQEPSTINFADVAHQTLIFDKNIPSEALILKLLDSRWVQRLRYVLQTGNTKLVYMFAEHSRFGHSLGVAHLANLLMRHLKKFSAAQIEPYEQAVSAAALLHDIGHVAPGSHLAERIWGRDHRGRHELVGTRIIRQDPEIRSILEEFDPRLPELVCGILEDSSDLPAWTREIISGSGWNADRGNWSIVDSTMCAVSYGRYNVLAIIDAFRLTEDGQLVLQESRLDALTHFFVARDSMYRQIYQHRALQAVDALTVNLIERARDIAHSYQKEPSVESAHNAFSEKGIFVDESFLKVLLAEDYSKDLSIEAIFCLTEPWWYYHLLRWCECQDEILRDLAIRLRDRRLFKTIRLTSESSVQKIRGAAEAAAQDLGYDPRYYVVTVEEADTHRGKDGETPQILLDSGKVVPVVEVEPLIAQLLAKPVSNRRWLAVPQEVKEKLGYTR